MSKLINFKSFEQDKPLIDNLVSYLNKKNIEDNIFIFENKNAAKIFELKLTKKFKFTHITLISTVKGFIHYLMKEMQIGHSQIKSLNKIEKKIIIRSCLSKLNISDMDINDLLNLFEYIKLQGSIHDFKEKFENPIDQIFDQYNIFMAENNYICDQMQEMHNLNEILNKIKYHSNKKYKIFLIGVVNINSNYKNFFKKLFEIYDHEIWFNKIPKNISYYNDLYKDFKSNKNENINLIESENINEEVIFCLKICKNLIEKGVKPYSIAVIIEKKNIYIESIKTYSKTIGIALNIKNKLKDTKIGIWLNLFKNLIINDFKLSNLIAFFNFKINYEIFENFDTKYKDDFNEYCMINKDLTLFSDQIKSNQIIHFFKSVFDEIYNLKYVSINKCYLILLKILKKFKIDSININVLYKNICFKNILKCLDKIFENIYDNNSKIDIFDFMEEIIDFLLNLNINSKQKKDSINIFDIDEIVYAHNFFSKIIILGFVEKTLYKNHTNQINKLNINSNDKTDIYIQIILSQSKNIILSYPKYLFQDKINTPYILDQIFKNKKIYKSSEIINKLYPNQYIPNSGKLNIDRKNIFKNLSAYSIKNLIDCSYKFLLNKLYIKKLKLEESIEQGKKLHKIIEIFFKGNENIESFPDEIKSDIFFEICLKRFKDITNIYLPEETYSNLNIHLISYSWPKFILFLKKNWQNNNKSIKTPNFISEYNIKNINIEVLGLNINLSGFIDYIELKKDYNFIIDFKTSMKNLSKNAVQLIFYSICIDIISNSDHNFKCDNLLGFWDILNAKFIPLNKKKIENEVISLKSILNDKIKLFCQSKEDFFLNPKNCKYCDYDMICRKDEIFSK